VQAEAEFKSSSALSGIEEGMPCVSEVHVLKIAMAIDAIACEWPQRRAG
jgi:hypothetical protein